MTEEEKKIASVRWAVQTLRSSAYSYMMSGQTKEFWLDNVARQDCLDILTESQIKHLLLYVEREVEITKKERADWK